ncbi:MAG: Glycoside hydrolase 18 protein [Icmadophila ericetorum]|nr:Glycoside hydrolase 18 protein [Icmadophila ericetorum]
MDDKDGKDEIPKPLMWRAPGEDPKTSEASPETQVSPFSSAGRTLGGAINQPQSPRGTRPPRSLSRLLSQSQSTSNQQSGTSKAPAKTQFQILSRSQSTKRSSTDWTWGAPPPEPQPNQVQSHSSGQPDAHRRQESQTTDQSARRNSTDWTWNVSSTLIQSTALTHASTNKTSQTSSTSKDSAQGQAGTKIQSSAKKSGVSKPGMSKTTTNKPTASQFTTTKPSSQSQARSSKGKERGEVYFDLPPVLLELLLLDAFTHKASIVNCVFWREERSGTSVEQGVRQAGGSNVSTMLAAPTALRSVM